MDELSDCGIEAADNDDIHLCRATTSEDTVRNSFIVLL